MAPPPTVEGTLWGSPALQHPLPAGGAALRGRHLSTGLMSDSPMAKEPSDPRERQKRRKTPTAGWTEIPSCCQAN